MMGCNNPFFLEENHENGLLIKSPPRLVELYAEHELAMLENQTSKAMNVFVVMEYEVTAVQY